MDKFIRDNVHGDIHIKDSVIKELIDTKEFQRLRRIIQLGGGQFVFPGANHTRFSHCIGVYCVINKFLANEKISNAISEKEALVVQIAGLLHDIGHGPFSHTFESISSQAHEQYTIDIIIGNTQINQVLKSHNIDPQEVASIIEGKHKNNILNLLVSSQLDADRLDYLLRDSINTGVDYANLDIEWIIRNASIFENKMVFKIKTLNALEHYLLGRYYMFKQIYNHKVSQAFDITFTNWFTRLKDLYWSGFKFKNQFMIDTLIDLIEEKTCDLNKYNRLDDYTMIEFIKSSIDEQDDILAKLSQMLINRKFLKISSELSNEQFEKLKENYSIEEQKYYFTIIKNEKFNIYKSNDAKKDEKIYLLKNEQLFEITQISEILEISPKNIEKNVFVFINDNVK
ncbi:HD domain-containing protein [Spiroplasma culicicola]|uniref:HD superfamily phosphohydrolase n=1 Tax=Spiroplasma culicicola AES-1 TaxID=1276246 RepID=W6A893_9MOLU|nr:HD domain-containing protein [Spiroplasma culicicola]AHI53378.1 HD superfamily phosphohydrolase [Spiroplasma culicicola AES-1]